MQVDIIAGKLGAVTHRSVIVPHRSVGKIALQRGAYLLNEGADTLLQAVLGKLRLGNFQSRQRLHQRESGLGLGLVRLLHRPQKAALQLRQDGSYLLQIGLQDGPLPFGPGGL